MYLRNLVKPQKSFFMQEGKSEYKIVLPQNPDLYEKKAAKELNEVISMANCTPLAVVCETDIDCNKESKLILLGKCDALKNLNITLDYNELEEDGYIVFSYGNLYIIAGLYRGTLFAVYEFLKHTFSYAYYAQGEISIIKDKDIQMYEFDICDRPDIASRSFGFYDTYQLQYEEVELNSDRLRIARNNYTDWIKAGHTYFEILPKEKYYAAHSNWYSPDGANLCLSNSEMAQEFIENVKKISIQIPDKYFMLGQEDNFEFCNCEKCKNNIKKLGSESALMMQFSNKVAKQTGDYLKKVAPKRNVLFVTFAYNKTSKPPVKYDEVKKSYLPISPQVIAEDNLSVMVVPFSAVYNYDFFDEQFNKHVKESFLGWQACCKQLSIWSYCVNFDNYMVEFNNYHTIQSNYKIFKNLGTVFLFDQGPYSAKTPCFDELKLYMHSKLAWDTNLDSQTLIDGFMRQYYKDIAPLAERYRKKMVERWNYISKEYREQTRGGGGDTSYCNLAHFWTKEFLDECMDIFREARGVLESIRVERWDDYMLLRPRLKKLTLSVRFLLINIYGGYYGSELKNKIEAFKADMRACGIEKMNEGSFMQLTE